MVLLTGIACLLTGLDWGASLSFPKSRLALVLHFLGPFQLPVCPLALTLMTKLLGFCGDL